MRFTSGVGLYLKVLGIMLALTMTGCFGAPELSNPFYKYYKKSLCYGQF